MALCKTIGEFSSGLHSPLSLAAFVGVPLGVGFLSSMSMGNAVNTWYKYDLKKPSWTPPAKVFPPVWTFLYASMGYAAHRIFHIVPMKHKCTPLALYGTQLVLNFMWTPLFFRYKRFGASVVNITVLVGAVISTTITFARNDTISGLLMLPYCAWMSYASALTWWIWRNNPNFRQRLGKRE